MASASSTRPAIYKYLRTPRNTFRRVGVLVLDERFPESYKNERRELETKEPIPVHWIPEKGKYKIDPQTGLKTRVQNTPIPVLYPKEADKGLWGGEGIVKGFIKKESRKRRVPRYWFPCLMKRAFYSEILDKYMEITVTPRTMYLIDDAFGFDNYILKTHAVDLKSKLGMDLKRKMLLALARKDFYPDDPKQQEKIYNRYKQYAIPEKEAEWVGLSLLEAGEKLRDETKTVHIPLKQIYAEELLKRLQETKLQDTENPDSERSWLSRINPFGSKEQTQS